MALNKSPSTALPNCSELNNRPESSSEKLNMRTKLKSFKTDRPSGLTSNYAQPLKPSSVPCLHGQQDSSPDAPPVRPASVNTLRPPSAAQTRSWSPGSVLVQPAQSEPHLPNPRLAKLLDRGWKSSQLLPNYPKVGPDYNISRASSEFKSSPTKSGIPSQPVEPVLKPRLHSSLQSPPTNANDTRKTPSPAFPSQNDWEPELQLDDRSNLDSRGILLFPGTLRAGSEPSRIPIRRMDAPNTPVDSIHVAENDISRTSTPRLCSSGIDGIYRRPSCIPIPLFNSQSKDMILTARTEIQPADPDRHLTSSTPRPGTGRSTISQPSRIPIAHLESSPPMSNVNAYNLVNTICEPRRVRSEVSKSSSKIPVPTRLPEKALNGVQSSVSTKCIPYFHHEKATTVRNVSVGSLQSLAQNLVSQFRLKPNVQVQEVPSLTSLAQTAIDKKILKPKDVVRNLQKVPRLASLAQKALDRHNLIPRDIEQKMRKVPSLTSLAQKAIDKHTLIPRDMERNVREVPSLTSLAQRTIYQHNLIPRDMERNVLEVPSLTSLAQGAIDQHNLIPRDIERNVREVPSLTSLAQRTIYQHNLIPRDVEKMIREVPSLMSFAQRAIDQHNLIPRDMERNVREVPSLTSFAQRATDQHNLIPRDMERKVREVPSLTSLAQRTIDQHNLIPRDMERNVQEVPSLTSLAKRATDQNNLIPRDMERNVREVPSLTSLAQIAIDQHNLIPRDMEKKVREVPSLTSLARRAINQCNFTPSDVIRKMKEVPSLTPFTKSVIDQFSLNQLEDERKEQEVQSLTSLSQGAIAQFNLCTNNVVRQVQRVPNLKSLAQNAVREFILKQNAIVQKPQLPSLKSLAQNAILDFNIERNTAMPTEYRTPAGTHKMELKISRASSAKRLMSSSSTKRSRPPTRMSARIVRDRDVIDRETFNAQENDKTDKERSVKKRTQSPGVADGNLMILFASDASETNIQTADEWERNSCDETEINQFQRNDSVDLDLYFKSYMVKAEVPSLRELAEMAVKRNAWLERSERDFAKPRISLVTAGSLDTVSSHDLNMMEVKDAGSPGRHQSRRDVESGRKLNSANTKRSRPQSRPPSRSPTSISDSKREFNSTELKMNQGNYDECSMSALISVEEKDVDAKGEAKLTEGQMKNDVNPQKPKFKEDNKFESVAKKVDPEKIRRLKGAHGEISDTDVYEMISSIQDGDRDAAEMLRELTLLNELEKEQNITEFKIKEENSRLAAEMGDFKTKLADTIEKKKNVNVKLLEMCEERLEPDTEFDIIESYLHTENLARTYHEKKNLEECCIGYLKHEIQSKLKLKKAKEQDVKLKVRKIGERPQNRGKGIVNKNGTKINGTKIDKGKENQARRLDKNNTEAINFKDIDSGYKPICKEEKLKRDSITLRKANTAADSSAIKTRNKYTTRREETESTNKSNTMTSVKKISPPGKKLQPIRDNVNRNVIQSKARTSLIKKQNKNMQKTSEANEMKINVMTNNRNRISVNTQERLTRSVTDQTQRDKNVKHRRDTQTARHSKVPETEIKPAGVSQVKHAPAKLKKRTQEENASKDLQKSSIKNNSEVKEVNVALTRRNKTSSIEKQMENAKLKRPKLEPNKLRRDTGSLQAKSAINKIKLPMSAVKAEKQPKNSTAMSRIEKRSVLPNIPRQRKPDVKKARLVGKEISSNITVYSMLKKK